MCSSGFLSPGWKPTFPFCSWTSAVTLFCQIFQTNLLPLGTIKPTHFLLFLLPADDFQSSLSAPLAGGLDALLSGEDEDDFFELQIVKNFEPEVKTLPPLLFFFLFLF